MWQKRYQTSCVDKIWSRKNFLTNGNVNHLVQIRSVAIGASTQDSPMTWFDRSRMLSYESANLLKELLRQDDCTRAECVIRNIAYYLQSLEKANYNFSGKVSVGSSSLQARLICRVAGSASPAEQQVNCNSARCRILRTIDSASGSGEASRVFISWLNREDSMEWILLAPCG